MHTHRESAPPEGPFKAWLQPVDTSSLGVFRVGLGLLFVYKAWHNLSAGRIARTLNPDQWHVPWPGFDFIHPPELWVSVLVQLAMAVIGVLIALGVGARLWLLVVAAEMVWFQLVDQTHYLNHHFLAVIVCVTLALSPCDRVYALDQRWRNAPVRAPAMGLWMLRVTVVIVYVYAGIAKLDADWLAGRPMEAWMAARAHVTVIGPLVSTPGVGTVMAWCGLFIDLVGGPALLFRRTRGPAILVLAAFHLSNAALFNIGIFPWMMLFVDLLFLDPDWPRRFISGRTDDRVVVAASGWWRLPLAAWVAVQVVVPLRHHLYPGPVAWTEEGHRLSWRMMLRSKSGALQFRVVDLRTGTMHTVDVRELLSAEHAREVMGHPDAVWTLARRLRLEAEAEGRTVAVYAHHPVSLNGREPALLIDPAVDLSRADRHVWSAAPWILPLDPETPLAE